MVGPFPTAKSFLPLNATAFEQVVEQALLYRSETPDAVDLLRGIKLNPSDALLPWLVWEYGLNALVPYLPNLRTVLKEGLLWQKERGTEAAVRRALGWADITPTVFEHETPGVHWNEYQLDTGKVPHRHELTAIIALAAMSAPARSVLRRLYHGCDKRRLILDGSTWGDLLSDDSGVRPTEWGGRLALSFCYREQWLWMWDSPTLGFSQGLTLTLLTAASASPLLDQNRMFGETALPVPAASVCMTTAQVHYYLPAGQGWLPQPWLPQRWHDHAWFADFTGYWLVQSQSVVKPKSLASAQLTLSNVYQNPMPRLDDVPVWGQTALMVPAADVELYQSHIAYYLGASLWQASTWPHLAWLDFAVRDDLSGYWMINLSVALIPTIETDVAVVWMSVYQPTTLTLDNDPFFGQTYPLVEAYCLMSISTHATAASYRYRWLPLAALSSQSWDQDVYFVSDIHEFRVS